MTDRRAETNTRFAWEPRAMDWRGVLDIGIAALERNWIAPEVLTRALTLFRAGGFNDPRELWVKSQLLTAEQVDALSRSIDVAYMDALYGDHAGERYVVERPLDEGGMGRILVCHDRALGRKVAIKVLRDDLQTTEHARSLAREARVTGNLEHPGIIPVYDAGVSDGEGPFYAMRLVEQHSLEHVLTGLRQRDQAISATWTLHRLLRTFIQVCQAVHYAHSRDVIHCDIKPANILLGSFGEVLVSDWGMAYARDQKGGINGGTPAYMAPEQLTGAEVYDARTDVFALGVVLYRILALRSPYRGTRISEVLQQREAGHPPPRPSSVAPTDRVVPAELEEIAMQAMEIDPAKRFASAEALAAAVDSFLEGTREREQRQRRAEGLVAQGDELAARYHEAREERQKLVQELAALTLSVDPWQPLEERRRVWDCEDELAVVEALQVRILQEAISSYEQALVERPKHAAARSGLARLYADRVERARERRADLDRIYFEGLLRQYDDDGILVRAGGQPGWLNIEVTGDIDGIVLAPMEERDRQYVPGPERRLRRTALEAVPAAPGSYLLSVESGGHRLRVPVLVRGDRETHVILDLEKVGLPGPDEVYVPGGPAALGLELAGYPELRDVDVAPFFIQTFPVTFGAYREFLDHVLAEDPQRIARLIPQVRDGVPLWVVDSGGLVPTLAHADLGITEAHFPRTPVFGIDALAAMQYAQWWSARTGHVYRLPTESEWEKAARGVDGRRFPWGDRFESIFCKMRLSRPGQPQPEPVGAFPSDVSPYGVRDMAGGIADFCTPVGPDDHKNEPAVALASRGGAWSDSDADCAVTARRRVHIDERSARIGFRLVRDGARST